MLSPGAMSPTAKVLVVEDEEPLALLLRYNLEAEGYAVDVVHRGDEAEVAIAESSPDLIVLDWMLPGISGLELCRRLRTGKESGAGAALDQLDAIAAQVAADAKSATGRDAMRLTALAETLKGRAARLR